MKYLEAVNYVLRRMREKEVSNANATSYSRLIGDLINDVKNEVELAWDWNSLRDTVFITTEAETLNYVLSGAVQGTKLLNAWNDTTKSQMSQMSTVLAEQRFLTSRALNSPTFYSINGVNSQGFLQVDVWPIPDAVYELTFNAVVPQTLLIADEEPIRVPWRPVVEGSVARAIQERGEDGGTTFEAAMDRYRRSLSDAIALDATLHNDETTWYVE